MAYVSQYTDAMLSGMQSAYGQGFLSPGGADELRRMVDGVGVEGRDVLDMGCGVGGAAILLAGEYGAARVLGIDVESRTLELARAAVEAAGLGQRIGLELVAPDSIPLPDGSFDMMLAKDVFCHVADKPGLVAAAFRVLRPGGALVIGDWIIDRVRPPSAAYDGWFGLLSTGGLQFLFGTAADYVGAMEGAGFRALSVRDNSAAAEADARRQLEDALGPAREATVRDLGEQGAATRNAITLGRADAIASGTIQHYHFQARKPA
jgi:phosphoethanolamine N-methyltransferase